MPIGITNASQNITMQQIMDLTNTSSYSEFAINVNNSIYDGWLYFILLITFMIIIFISANKNRDQILNNLMYSAAATTILSLVLRAVYIVREGIALGLISDVQLWFFPVFTTMIAVIVYANKEK